MVEANLRAERERIGEAILDLVTTGGYQAATVEAVIERAGVERQAFDALFKERRTVSFSSTRR